jgi:predicted ATPase/DNA-binding CsgD family transcriptional regulator
VLEPEQEPLIAQVRDRREQLHLSQEQAAQLIGVSFTTLNRWEQGRSRPGPRSRRQLEAWLRDTAQIGEVLPADATSFIGRDSELDKLMMLWPKCRMLTLTGTGGIGKTRLAIELLRRREEHLLGVVQLDAVRDPALAIAAIGAGPGIRAKADVPALVTAARAASGVLFLDTCERVTSALRGLLRALLREAPAIRILATSQVELEVPGEQVWRVPGLGLDEGIDGDAIEFFKVRARERAANFSPDEDTLRDIAQICRRLNGIPLALELAAAFMSSASPADLLGHWDERTELLTNEAAEYERQQTMHAAAEWSADLLDPGDRELVIRLSAFDGPFALADIQGIGVELTDTAFMLALQRLTRASWLEFSLDPQPCYRMLDPLRAWASQELKRSGRAEATYRRQAEYFRDLCGRAEDAYFHVEPDRWPQRLELLDGSLQAALDRLIQLDAETGADIAVSLLGWWRLSGRLAQGRHWLERYGHADVADLTQARARCGAALLAMDAGNQRVAEHLATSAMSVLEERRDVRWLGRALTALSSAAKYRGDMALARSYLERAQKLQQRAGEWRELAVTLNNLGSLTADERDLSEAERYYRLSLEAKQDRYGDRSTALTMANLADILTLTGRLEEARAMLDEALAIVDRRDDNFLRAFVKINIGENLMAAGDPSGALAPFCEALAFATTAGAGRFQILATCDLGEAHCRAGNTAEGMRLLRQAVREGDAIIRRQAEDALARQRRRSRTSPLTDREKQVIVELRNGLSNREIAETLDIKLATVQRHVANILKKLDVSNRTAAVRKWEEQGR